MNDARLTDELAISAMGWRLAPGRYLKSGKSWITRSKFRPLTNARDAFRVLDTVTKDYSLASTPDGTFTVEVRLRGCVAKVTCKSRERAICLAVARVIGIEAGGQTNAPVVRASGVTQSRPVR